MKVGKGKVSDRKIGKGREGSNDRKRKKQRTKQRTRGRG